MTVEQPIRKSEQSKAEPVKNPREMAQMLDEDVESAYGEVLIDFGSIKGGVGDGGKDFESLDHNELPDFQIKSSWDGTKKFLAESLKCHKFIPVAIGEPGTAKEIIDSIKEFGGWVGKDEPMRDEYLLKIQKVRDAIQGSSFGHLNA